VKKNALLLAAILVVAAALRVVYVRASAPADDAFITFRYARNLAEGAGFVYNAGDRLLGTTTPLFTLLLAPTAAMGLPIEPTALVWIVLADLGTIWMLARIVGRVAGAAGGTLAAFVYALFYANASACGYGMEAPLLQFFLLVSIDAADRGRWTPAAIGAALATLTRPEGLIATAIVGGAFLLRARRLSSRDLFTPVAAYLALVLPWVLFAMFYFGSPIPNSVLIKARQAGITLREWMDFFFLRNPLLILLWVGSVLGTIHAVRVRSRGLVLLAIWLVSYVLFFLIGEPAFLGAWYFPPIGAGLVALSSAGAVGLGGRLLRRPAWAALAVAAAWLALSAVAVPRNLESARWGKRNADLVHRRMAAWVTSNTTPEELIQVSDIGYVGFYSRRRILDSSSLVSPEVLDFYEAHRDEPGYELKLVLEKKPDLLLIPVHGTNYRRMKDAGLLDHYVPLERFQVNMRSSLDPSDSTAMAYEQSKRFFADFLALRRIEKTPPPR
jgi:hypothetical protein